MAGATYTASGIHLAANTGNTGVDISTAVSARIRDANVVVAASQTDSVLIAAVSGSKIRVLGVTTGAAGTATDWTLGSKAGAGATTTKMGPFRSAASNYTSTYGDYGMFDCVDSEGLVVTTGAGANVTFFINYVLI